MTRGKRTNRRATFGYGGQCGALELSAGDVVIPGDFDGDGQADLMVDHTDGRATKVYLADGATFAGAVDFVDANTMLIPYESYALEFEHSALRMDVEGVSTANGAEYLQWGQNNQGNPSFRAHPRRRRRVPPHGRSQRQDGHHEPRPAKRRRPACPSPGLGRALQSRSVRPGADPLRNRARRKGDRPAPTTSRTRSRPSNLTQEVRFKAVE